MELPAKLPFSKRRLRPRIVISYIFDYVILIACIIGFYILDSIEPFHQHFSLRNISLQYPYAVHERVPIALALAISGLFPIILIITYTLVIDGLFSHHKLDPTSGKRKLRGPYRWKDRLWEMNCGILGLLLAQGLAFVVTQVLKNACGKPRPDLIARCQPPAGSHDEIPGLSTYTICTGDPALIKDGFRSWPSGHSSSSFAGLGYTALWLGGKLHVMDNRGEVWKTLLIMVPLIAATLIAVSRIMDARHHPFDVITGGLLGLITGYVSYRQYFPPITEAWRKGRAYPIRTWGTDPVDPHGDTKTGQFDESAAALRNPEEEQLGLRQSNTTAAPYLGSTNPFVSPAYPRRPHDHDPDGNWSSSEDDLSDVYEMQHGYAATQNPAVGRSSPQYTGYPPQMMPTGGLSAPSVTVSHPGRGQPLTDPA
ncbi:Phosphatidic acid phosphatase type 2/haloperoxidase [Penicillium lagena]|uniref:Phosphatidic acid phosphatase type 2/haloperoxidase n=1 Tax=Penicillium lagena TaxID=94218 RepID=UPI002541C75A|nr:Phosphatidic acid phosphatase type 2/haloperoxidase [Penicillium lagena]KAJ5610651.1 Phosphatidic acid phosphatase type 2/haloperoxidase [Penicillium lagena]